MIAGSLTIVGTGIQFGPQTTLEAKHALKAAEKVFYLMPNAAAAGWIHSLNPETESLAGCYKVGESRYTAYHEMENRVLQAVRSGLKVCVAFYGHPGVFVRPARGMLHRATEEGYSARLSPGISAEDCLFVDLGLDPAESGCQSFEATDFLLHRRRFDPRSALVLWQVGVIGHQTVPARDHDLFGLRVLSEELTRSYPQDHEVVLYEAAELPISNPRVERCPLSSLSKAHATMRSTLYVPALPTGEPDSTMAARLSWTGGSA